MIATVGELVVLQVLFGSPFGEVRTSFRVVQGRVVNASVGMVADPDVVVRRRYDLALRERAGSLDLLESLEDGSVTGGTAKLMLLAGLYDSEECIEARRLLTTPSCESLITLGEILSSPQWTSFAIELARTAEQKWIE